MYMHKTIILNSVILTLDNIQLLIDFILLHVHSSGDLIFKYFVHKMQFSDK